MGETQAMLDKRWALACKILLGEELGSLNQYSAWLRRNNEPLIHRQSSISGKNTAYSIASYAENSKWISFDEIDFSKKFSLNIDEIKDIDSLASALSDRFYYAGNVVLGNSGNVEKSSNISDSFYMQETGKLADSKYIAYSTLGRLNSDCFGCNGIGESEFCIKCYETFRDRRCFELWMGQNCSDCFYSHNLNNCQECIFCFNLKNAKYSIGNLPLPPAKYKSIKENLLSQIADELKRKKEIPSLVEFVQKSFFEKPALFNKPVSEPPKEEDRTQLDSAFSKVISLIFGKTISLNMDECADWLTRYTRAQDVCPSAASGKPVYRRDYASYFALPKNRMLKFYEAQFLGAKLKLNEGQINSLTLATFPQLISKIAFFASEYYDGTNSNLIECATSSDSMNCYRSSPIVHSKYCGYCFWPRSTTYSFGCESVLSCDFCLKCYNSVKLVRCFELDSCRDCSDCFYSHNCENVHESMFCFNGKNLRFAIGNVEQGKEKYMQFKKALLAQLSAELQNTKNISRSVFTLAAD